MHRGVAKGNEIAGIQEDVVEAGQVDDDDDPSNCDIHRNSGGEAVAIRSGLKKNNFPASRLVRYLKAGIESRNFVDFLHIITPCFDFSQFVRPMSILTNSYASFDS